MLPLVAVVFGSARRCFSLYLRFVDFGLAHMDR